MYSLYPGPLSRRSVDKSARSVYNSITVFRHWRSWVPLASVLVVAGGPIVLRAAGIVDWVRALLLAGILAAVMSMCLLLLVLRRVDLLGRHVQREIEARKSDIARLVRRLDQDREKMFQLRRADWTKLTDRLASDRAELRNRLRGERELVLKRLETAIQTLRLVRKKDVPKLMEDQKRRFKSSMLHVTRQGQRDYEQHVAWWQLNMMLEPARTMPPLRGWAASPDVLCLLVETIRKRSPRLTVECGSGASSVWLGLALRRFGGGRLVTLEHDAEFAARSRSLVAGHDLNDIVEVRLAPLKPWSSDGADSGQLWYDLESVADLVDIDLIFVDGPPHTTGPQARYPAGPILLPRCSERCVVVLDDTDRPDEQSATDRWVEAYPGFRSSKIRTEKGTEVLIRGS